MEAAEADTKRRDDERADVQASLRGHLIAWRDRAGGDPSKARGKRSKLRVSAKELFANLVNTVHEVSRRSSPFIPPAS